MVLMQDAPAELRDDPQVQKALAADPNDPYAANEAFYIRSESNRVVLIANTPDGLLNAVVELLESVDYEVLGMGPNWTHVPDYRDKPLTFTINRADRPSYYLRNMWTAAGQSYGVGTITRRLKLADPADEPVEVSYDRWRIGTRMVSHSMPDFPGHALQAYHDQVLEHMRSTGDTEGFLSVKTIICPESERPQAGTENKGWLWIDPQPANHPRQKVTVCYSDGKQWKPGTACMLDLSVPYVRQMIFDKMIQRATDGFTKQPNEPVIFGIDAEDGAAQNDVLDQRMRHLNWYPEYLAKEGLPFGRPYLLHGQWGIDQPREIWDPSAASDNMFALAAYLLHEFDKWVDSLPADQQATSTGQSKKQRIRCSFYSYNFHDVPPNFNPDPRSRVMIAGYPKHRGRGKWLKLATHVEVAKAYSIMLPNEPTGIYDYLSIAQFWDMGTGGIPATQNVPVEALSAVIEKRYDTGVRALSAETDFNFGKDGLRYYLISKKLWNVKLSPRDLDAIRDRWFQRSFGSAWTQMKAYYDFMLVGNYPCNTPRTWGQAVRLIDAADQVLDGQKEPQAQRRIDDVKQYWYFHYLANEGLYAKDGPEIKEYLWKGQMSYMVAMHAVSRLHFNKYAVADIVGPQLMAGPAHYTHEETQAWWSKVLEHWKVSPVVLFADGKLANGKPAASADLNALVMVRQFQSATKDVPFLFNGPGSRPIEILVTAGKADELIGFTLTWPFAPQRWGQNDAKETSYGVDIWDPSSKSWENWIDQTMTSQLSREMTDPKGEKLQVVDVRLKAPRAGTFRFKFGPAGFGSRLGSVTFDPTTDSYAAPEGFTYSSNSTGLTQSPVYFYIPKGTRSLDLDIWDKAGNKFVHLYKGLPAGNAPLSRKVDVSTMGTHTVPLEPGEDGTVAMLTSNGFAFPYMYSVPTLWAKSPGALLVPRAIAEADGLTPMP
jgi:hypothetical protein